MNVSPTAATEAPDSSSLIRDLNGFSRQLFPVTPFEGTARAIFDTALKDMQDIEIDDDRFMFFCVKFKYLGSYFVPEINDTADITERISQARKLFGSMNKQLLSNKKTPIDIRRKLYQAIVVNIELRGSESWAMKEANISKLEAFHHGCLRGICGLTMCMVGAL
jgi:hypothetical protein